MTDRVDEMLAEAIATGVIPEGVSADERAELEDLLDATRVLETQAPAIRAEAEASMPIARARFERFLQQEQQVPAQQAHPAARRSVFGLLGGRGLPMRGVAAAAAILALVVVGAFVAPALLDDVETANAEVLVPGEYVQFEAVSGETDGDTFDVDADFGNVQVVIDGDTELVDGAGAPTAGVRPGRVVVVGGVVGEDRRVRARSIAVSDAEVPRPEQRRPLPLDEFRDVGGRIVAFALGDDGQPRVAILTNDELVVVKVDAPSLEALLDRESAVGANVNVVRVEGTDRPVFGVRANANDVPNRPPPPGDDRPMPQIASISGVASSVAGGTLSIMTESGERQVALTLSTHFRVLDPTFDRADGARDQLLGRSVVAFVKRPIAEGTLPIADLVIVGAIAE